MSAAHWKVGILGAALLALAAACTVTGAGGAYEAGYGYDYGDVGYVGGIYEPYGYEYGGWGGRYHVGPPPRGGWHGGGEGHSGDGRAIGHPAGGRSAPSIPSRPRGR